MMEKAAAVPTKIILHKVSKTLEIHFDNGQHFILPCAYLRAHSTSAEMRQASQPVNPHVNILTIEPVGNYAIKPVFSDGHQTGIYSWDTLYQLSENYLKEQESYGSK